jgi:hypothetical protein
MLVDMEMIASVSQGMIRLWIPHVFQNHRLVDSGVLWETYILYNPAKKNDNGKISY